MDGHQRRTCSLALAAALLVGAGGCGGSAGGTITSVRGWSVWVATTAGKWIGRNASTLEVAIFLAWQAYCSSSEPTPINGVLPDKADPLRGTSRNAITLRIGFGGSAGHAIEIHLAEPRMVRESVESPIGNLAPEVIEQAIEQAEAISKQHGLASSL